MFQLAVVTLGGAYAVLAYVAQEAVTTFGWLKPGEMLDGLGNGRDHAGAADHGDPVRRLPRRVSHRDRAAAAARRDAGRDPHHLGDPCFLWVFAGGTLDVPVLATINWPALLLAAGAVAAVFRFRLGVLPVLGTCACLGAAYVLLA